MQEQGPLLVAKGARYVIPSHNGNFSCLALKGIFQQVLKRTECKKLMLKHTNGSLTWQ